MPKITRRGQNKKKRGERGVKSREVTLWQRRLHLAEKKLEDAGGDTRGKGKWARLIQLFEGKYWAEGEGGASGKFHQITSNLIKSTIDSIRPQLYFRDPKVKIKIKNPSIAQSPFQGSDGVMIPPGRPIAMVSGQWVDAQVQIDLMEAVDNYYLKEMGVKKVVKRSLNDALILPFGCVKLEWWIETEMREVTTAVNDDTGEPTQTEMREVVVWQKPIITRIKPWRFIWDAKLDEFDTDKADWYAEIKYMSLAELEEDPFLKFKKNDLGDPQFSLADEIENDEEETEDFQRYKVYEIHDLKNRQLLVWIDGSEKFARNETHPYADIEGGVYSTIGFDETPGSAYPLALPDQIKSKVHARNWILSYALNHIQRFNRKYIQLRGNMDPDEKERFETGADGTVVEVKSMGGGPIPIKEAGLSIDMYNVEAILKREVTEDLGVSAMNRAAREPGVETATEVQKIQSGADVKMEEKREAVTEWMESIVLKLNQILQLYLDTKEVIKIVGPEGDKWIEWSREDIQGQFIPEVDIYSGLPFSLQEDRRQAMEMFALIQQDPLFDPYEVRAEVRKRMNWPEKVLRPREQQMQQDPMAQAAAQQQNVANQSTQLRPNGPDTVKRAPDILGQLLGASRQV